MNKEEKEAIEHIKYLIEFTEDVCLYSTDNKSYKIVLNLIDKLQKQLDQLKEVDRQICNEELITKDKYQDILKENAELKEDNKKLNDLLMLSELDYISKDIIRTKIKELEERDKIFKLELPEDVTIYQYIIEVLNELLGGE